MIMLIILLYGLALFGNNALSAESLNKDEKRQGCETTNASRNNTIIPSIPPQSYIEKGADIQFDSLLSLTPLHVAALFGNL